MRFRIELLKGTRILDLQREVEVHLKGDQRILVLVCFAKTSLPRRTIIQAIWPEVEISAARNRFRVALAKLKAALPGVLIETTEGFSIDPSVASLDLWDVTHEISQSENCVSEESEFAILITALSRFGGSESTELVRELAGEFAAAAAEASLRASQLAETLGHVEAGYRASRIGVRLAPGSLRLWRAYLTASWMAGRGEESIAELKASQREHLIQNQELIATIKTLRSSPAAKEQAFKAEEGRVILEAFELIEQARPDLWRAILSSPQTLSLSGKHPRQMHELLSRATRVAPEQRDTTWDRTMARMIGLKAWLNDSQGVLDSAPELIENTADPQILRAVWNSVAVAHSLHRNWKEADEALKITEQYALQLENPIYVITTRGNGAYFLFQQARYEEALQQYDELIEKLNFIDTNQARFELAIAIGNRSLIPLYQGKWSQAVTDLEAAIKLRKDGELPVQMGILLSGLGLAKMQLGQHESVVSLTRAGFSDAFGTKSEGSQQISFEFGAGVLACANEVQYAASVLHWVNEWRLSIGHPRSKAENDLCNSFFPISSENVQLLDLTQMSHTEIGSELMKRLRAQIARS